MKTVLTEKHNFIESAKIYIYKSYTGKKLETKDKCKVILNYDYKRIEKYEGKIYIDTRILYLKMFEKKGYKVKMNKNNFVVKSNHSNEYNVIDYNDYEIEINGTTYSYSHTI